MEKTMQRVSALAMLAMGLLFPATAVAGDVACVWRALPEAARATSLDNYAAQRTDDILAGVEDRTLGEAIVKCVALPDKEKAALKVSGAVGLALASYIVQLGSQAFLEKELRIEVTALERAYGTMDPKRRRDLAASAQKNREPSKAVTRALVDALATAYPGDLRALADTPAFAQLVRYFEARAMREQAEATF